MPDSKTTIIPSGPPADYRPKRGGKRQEYWPEVTVRVAPTAADAAYYKARMGERLAEKDSKEKAGAFSPGPRLTSQSPLGRTDTR